MNAAFAEMFVMPLGGSLRRIALGVAVASSLVVPFAASAQPAGHAAQERNAAGPMRGMQHGDEPKATNGSTMAPPSTGNADVDFAQAMRARHQGAMDMAEAQLKNGKDSSMRKLARDVINAQRKQIVRIDRFLAEHGPQAKKS
jgi:uncharacterized protein (DUF305 family)